MKRLLHLTLPMAAAAMLWLSSCGQDVRNSSSEYHRVDPDGWSYADRLTFKPEHLDSVCEGSLVVGLRHEGDYPYSNLWLEISYTDARDPLYPVGPVKDGKRRLRRPLRRDTVEIRLCDPYGAWTGRGIGTSFQVTDTVNDLIHASGTPVMVRHLMRSEMLEGVNQVGLFFVPKS